MPSMHLKRARAEYLATFGYSLRERGARDALIAHYRMTAQALAADLTLLYRIARAITAGDRAAVRFALEQHFQLGADGRYHNAKLDREIAKARRLDYLVCGPPSRARKRSARVRGGRDVEAANHEDYRAERTPLRIVSEEPRE